MKIQSCLPGRRASLSRTCGPNIDTSDVLFSARENNLVYMDKVYSYNQETACPILSCFDGSCNAAPIELLMHPGESGHNHGHGCGCRRESQPCREANTECCGSHTHGPSGSAHGRGCPPPCCCVPCEPQLHCGCCTPESLNEDSVFHIDRSYVLVKQFGLADPAGLMPSQITLNGKPVDFITPGSGQYAAGLDTILPEITKTRCTDLGLPTKAFLLAENVGPWVFQGTFVLEGTVITGGRSCCFQAKITLEGDNEQTICGTSTFAVPRLSIPCATNGMTPVLYFQFGGAVNMIDPHLCMITCGNRRRLVLHTHLAAQPMIHTEVVKRTLFCLEACQGLLPCDGTEEQYDTEEDDSCTWEAPCTCGTAVSPERRSCHCETRPVCHFDEKPECSCESRPLDKRPENAMQYLGCNGCSW